MAMAKKAKIWTALGVAMLAGAGAAEAGTLQSMPPIYNPQIILVDGEGGEGGGEGGGTSSTTTYALQSTDAKAYSYDATPQIDAYINLAFKSYEKAADDAAVLAKVVDAFLAAQLRPSKVKSTHGP
jgi:hypothetical protein